MKICIDTDVLFKHSTSISEFLVLLMNYLGIDYKKALEYTLTFGYTQQDSNDKDKIVLSDNIKDLVPIILMESSPKPEYYPIADYQGLAQELQSIFPRGNKEGTDSSWRSSTDIVAMRLMIITKAFGFVFTEFEALNAARWYVHHWQDELWLMKPLADFLLNIHKGQIDSDFMTIIENQRRNNK